MAQPPLEYQIRHSKLILLGVTSRDSGGIAYVVEEAWHGTSPERAIRTDTKIFELLGYTPVPGERVVLIFHEDELLEILPVRNGMVVYAPVDLSVRTELSLEAFKERVRSVFSSFSRAAAFSFESPLSMKEMFEKLNSIGLWRWIERDSDRHGDYLSALADPDYAMIKIFAEERGYVLQIHCKSEHKDTGRLFSDILTACQHRVLPSLGARKIEPAESRE